MIKVGVLGTNFGKYHAQLYKKIEGFQLMGVFGRDEHKLSEIAKELNIRTTNRIEDLVYDSEIDMIDICLPTQLHCKWVIESLKSGKYVFCETPLTYSIEECEKIREASRIYGKFVYTDLFFKFSYPHMCAINKVRNGELGTVLAVKSINKTSPKWGNLGLEKNISNFHIHNMDFIAEMLGVPSRLTASGRGSDNMSTVVSILGYKECIAVVESSSNLPETFPFCVGFEIICDRGALAFHGEYGNEAKEEFCQYPERGDVWKIPLKDINEYEEVLKHVRDCIEQNIDSKQIGIDSAMKSLGISNAVLESIQLGSSVQFNDKV